MTVHHATRFESRTEPLLHLTSQQALQIARTPRGLQRERPIDTYLAQRLEILSERWFGDNPLTITLKLCSHNFSDKTTVQGSTRGGFPDGTADRSPEGWGQGLEPRGPRPALAINDSNAKFNFSACPIHEYQASPGEQGTGKRQTSQGAGQGCDFFPREKKEPQPEAHRGKSRTNHRKSEMPEVSEHIQFDHQSGLPLVRLQASPEDCPQSTPLSEERWPGQCENWCFPVTSYASVVKGESGPAETIKEEKGTQQKKANSLEELLANLAADDPLREDLESQLEQLRAALKDPRNPG